MINKWQILRSILIKQMRDNFVQQNGTHRIFAVLRENDPSSKLPTIYIPNLPSNSVLIKTDHDKTEPVFFDSHFDLRRRGDYILLTELRGKNIVIHIELKSNTIEKEYIKHQMEGANCLLDYFEAVSRRLLKSPISFNDPSCIEHRYVVIYVPKKTSKCFKEKRMPQPQLGHRSLNNIFFYPVFSERRQSPAIIINYQSLVRI